MCWTNSSSILLGTQMSQGQILIDLIHTECPFEASPLSSQVAHFFDFVTLLSVRVMKNSHVIWGFAVDHPDPHRLATESCTQLFSKGLLFRCKNFHFTQYLLHSHLLHHHISQHAVSIILYSGIQVNQSYTSRRYR